MSPGLHLVTFASPKFEQARDGLVDSAVKSRQFASVDAWDETRLAEDESFPGRHLLVHPRGVGFWSWQPHLILSTLQRVPDGDAVLYYDSGRYRGGYTINRPLTSLVEYAAAHDGMLPGVLVPQFGPNSRWTRRDCFVLMDCDEPRYWNHPQVAATFSLWFRNEKSIRFVTEWQDYCTDIRIVGDGPNACGLPNHTDFVDHRHDQSVLTNLVIRDELTPFVIRGRVARRLIKWSRDSQAAHLFCKQIDNMSAVEDGVSASRLYLQQLVSYKLRRDINEVSGTG
jgi:hypothetical protein